MNLSATLRVALRTIGKNKLRAGLTILGVVIGIAAVTTMVSIGQSAMALVAGQFQTLGTNMIVVLPGRQDRGGVRQGNVNTLVSSDCDAILRDCPSVIAATPIVGAAGQVIYGNSNWSPREMMGVGPHYLTVRNWPLQRGGFFTERDIRSAAKVCVVGRTVVTHLFQTGNPMGETIRVNNIPFRIIGVLEEKGANLVGEDQDNILLIPYTTVRKRLHGSGFDDVHAILASARSDNQMPEAENEIRQLLLERHRITPGEPPDFFVQNTTEILEAVSIVLGSMTAMLSSIACISLVVGGVGIMNIMLVSVTERTREIGLRMAVGARSRDILRQFLVESVLLCLIGGVIGFALGAAASAGAIAGLNAYSTSVEWPTVVSLPAAGLAIVAALLVGIVSGFYPALRASRLDPIEALRYE
jgi:putative ABC transport system permease protein